MRARASKAVAGEHTHLMMAQETLEFMMQALYDRLWARSVHVGGGGGGAVASKCECTWLQ